LSTQYSTVRIHSLFQFIRKIRWPFFSSEGSSSPVPRAEPVINRPIDSIATPVSNTSLQHVQTYPPTVVDPSVNDNVDHYHDHSTNDV
jgi:hypothetical protein